MAWLGYMFDWDDFLRTQTVIKHELKQRAISAVNSIESVQASVETFFVDIEDKLNTWAGITDPDETIGIQQQRLGSTTKGLDSPQSNWALNHMKNGIQGMDASDTGNFKSSDVLNQILSDLQGLVLDEKGHIETTITQIEEQMIDKFSEMTALEVLKKILAIAGDLILKSARSVIVKVLDIAKILLTGLLDLLDAPIQIPVLSPKYKELVEKELSILDLVSLVGAIPATIAWKIITKKSLFPNNSAVASAIQTSDIMRATRAATATRGQKRAAPISTDVNVSSLMASMSVSNEVIDEDKQVFKAANLDVEDP